MLVNLSSDRPFVYKDGEIIFLNRRELENQLPEFFYKNMENIKNLYVINGPGYFSSTRVGVEVVNILLSLKIIKKVFYLNKIDFFYQKGFNNIYLFSGNKNKFIYLNENSYEVIFKKDMKDYYMIEELYEISIDGFNFINYENILKDYKNIKWKIATQNTLLKPFYIFEPIIC